METIKNKVTIQNLNKFNKMSLLEFELKKDKYKIELGNNYKYILAIKSGDLHKYTDKKDLEKIKTLSEYFFGTIPLRTQKALLEEGQRAPLKLSHEDFLDEYIRYLNARVYAEQNF